MRFLIAVLTCCVALATARIQENGQWRLNPYPGQAPVTSVTSGSEWREYPPNATELSYKGRWDSKHISWWAAPGLKFGFTGSNVAITFGNWTSEGVLVAYRVDGLDWQFSNVTANATYQFVSPATGGGNATSVTGNDRQTFEMRVTNYAYGVQIDKVWTASDGGLFKIPDQPLKLEFIGDSLTSGMYATYETIMGFGYEIGAGLGNAEFSVTAYPGICLTDKQCFTNPRGQTHQWLQTSDTSSRAYDVWGNNTEPWDFDQHQPADIVIINLGTNDQNVAGGNVSGPDFYSNYIKLIEEIHHVWPKAQVVVQTLWCGFYQVGNMWYQSECYVDEIPEVVNYFSEGGDGWTGSEFVHLFNTTGILQHNDIDPEWHPTDFGHIKVASHVLQYLKLTFGLQFASTGPEVQHATLYWNTETFY